MSDDAKKMGEVVQEESFEFTPNRRSGDFHPISSKYGSDDEMNPVQKEADMEDEVEEEEEDESFVYPEEERNALNEKLISAGSKLRVISVERDDASQKFGIKIVIGDVSRCRILPFLCWED